MFEKLLKHFNGDLAGKKIALWGLSFKPETDDMREAPSLVLIDALLKTNCYVSVFDPIAIDECKRRVGDAISYCSDKYKAVDGADALVLATEWKEFRLPNWSIVKKVMSDCVVVDGRNLYDKKELQELGFTYYGIGK